jgi:hypothetical protein
MMVVARLGTSRLLLLLVLALGVTWAPGRATAQALSGSISGRVFDETKQVLTGAAVTLTDEATALTRTLTTSSTGDFAFTVVPPGTYTVKIELDGFRSWQRTSISLPSGEQMSLGQIQMQVGGMTETITTTAEGSYVQTTSSERSALISSTQIQMLSARGRDVIDVLGTLPGVSYTTPSNSIGGSLGTNIPNIGGGRNGFTTMSVDGMVGNDLGNPYTFSSSINLDAISEVKVQLTSYQAEHGRNAGAVVNIVTKSGTKNYKGSAYWYTRNEGLNANDFFNNRGGIAKPLYRFNTGGFTLGGPGALPKVAGLSEKLFFFYSFDGGSTKTPQPLRQVTVPTALERQGDFSQSFDQNGALIVIKDPTTGLPFANNKIPQNRLNTNGQALLNVLPLPNALDRSLTKGTYNYTFQESLEVPKRQHVGRVDYKPTVKDSVYGVFKTWFADNKGYAVPAGSSNWGLIPQHYTFTDDSLQLNYTRVFTSNFVNEMSGGWRRSEEAGPPLTDDGLNRVTRSATGFTLGQFTPAINPLDIIPQASFAGVQNPANISYNGRFPLTGRDTLYTFRNTATLVRGQHILKAGLYAERTRNQEGADATFGGSFAFDRNTNNPLDSNSPYSNALLGVFSSYSESTSRPAANGVGSLVEWFAQDTWKIKRVTLDYGVRFGWYSVYAQDGNDAAAFSLERFDPSKTPKLYAPAIVNGARVGRNPLTGDVVSAALIGAVVPNSGDPVNGMVVQGDANYPSGFKDAPGLLVEPRVGFAWDVRGDGKTAVRGGIGLFHNPRGSGNYNWNATKNPPIQFTPIIVNSTMATLLQSNGSVFPGNVQGFQKQTKTPEIVSYSIGMQHDIGWGTVVDAAYVGSRGDNLLQLQNINTIPYGARFLPQNIDPTTNRPLPDAFLRPYQGYGDINFLINSGSSRYDALQVQVNRRFTRGLQFGVAYTYSTSKDYGSNDQNQLQIPLYQNTRDWAYGYSQFDQRHVAVINYTWDLPRVSRLWNSPIVRAVLDNWQLSGITAFVSGQPMGIGVANPNFATSNFTTVDGADLNGGGDGSRVIVTGNPQPSGFDRTVDHWFDPSVFGRPAVGQIVAGSQYGNTARDVIRLPGVHNWDMTLFKNVPLGGGSRQLQLRWEVYNLFNHTQFMTLDTTPRYDAAGNQVNANFGRATVARSPRVMQASLRFLF